MRAARWVALVAFLAAACAGSPQASPTPAPSPSGAETVPTAAASLPTAVPTAETSLPTAVPTAAASLDCPMVAGLTVHEFVEADPACFESRDVVLTAWLGRLPSMGWEAPYIQPSWLAYPPDFPLVALWERGPGGDAMCGGDPECALVILHLRPGTTIVLGNTARWVVAVGHRGDVAADSCHYVFDPAWTGPTPPPSQAQDDCRKEFVLSALRDAEPGSPAPEP